MRHLMASTKSSREEAKKRSVGNHYSAVRSCMLDDARGRGTRPLDCVFPLLLSKPDCFLLRFRRGVSVYCRVRGEVLLLPASRYPAPAVDLVVRHKDKDKDTLASGRRDSAPTICGHLPRSLFPSQSNPFQARRGRLRILEHRNRHNNRQLDQSWDQSPQVLFRLRAASPFP
ncbi:MAG: hypothetical protein PWR28_1960 [Synergistaceae bacterium]|nr:hypothetical protein [Synergistaceae bacterium]